MIIKSNPVGQLANRIYDFSTFIVFSIENNQKLIYPFFNEFEQYFSINESALLPRKVWLVKGAFRKTILKRFINLLALLKKIGLPIASFYQYPNGKDISQIKANSAFSLFGGGWYTDYRSFVKHEDVLKSVFTLKGPYSQNVSNLIKEAKTKCDILVGVHIRRGDYKEFLNGSFYFENAVYKEKMMMFQAIFPDKNVGFLICSNEEVKFVDFKEFNVFKPSTFFIEDLYSLSSCDYLLGPPSTFTMWASFIGNAPLFKIHSKEDKFSIKDFVVTKEY